jgi:hypothetical protein
MANEFVVRNGIISQNNIQVTGSLNATDGITGSLSGTAASASYVNLSQTASYVVNSISASYSFTASFTSNPSLTGTQGTQGTQGGTGAQGTQGGVGAQGTGGPQGTQGSTGPNGNVGIQGGQGVTGTQGTQGTQGGQGTQGAPGSQGPVGSQGAQGLIASPGPTGPPGSQGTLGSQGGQGPTGPPGGQGPTGGGGPTGGSGPTGTGGPGGSPGPTGPNNLAGTTSYIVRFAGTNNGTTGVTFDNTDKILVGASTASTNIATVWLYRTGNGSGRFNIIKTGSGTYDSFANYRDGTYVGGITYSNSASGFPTSSDYRLKYDLKNFNGLSLLSRIKVYDFAWKLDDTRSYGVIAHELKEVLPDAVNGEKDQYCEVDPTNIKSQGVDYSKIIPILIQSLQELEEAITELESK